MTELLQDNHFWVGLAFLVLVVILVMVGVPGMAAKALDARGLKIQAQLDEATRIREMFAEDRKRLEKRYGFVSMSSRSGE